MKGSMRKPMMKKAMSAKKGPKMAKNAKPDMDNKGRGKLMKRLEGKDL
jgi:hypothetical protein